VTDVLDLFAGPGGWSVALGLLGLSEVGVEWEANTCRTARAAGHVRHHGDVRYYVPDRWFPGLIASPPCQTFSTAGDGDGRDALDRLCECVELVAYGMSPTDALALVAGTAVVTSDLGFTLEVPVAHDERTALVLEPMRVIRQMRPQWIALEQVPPVLPIWQAYARVLATFGYSVDVGVVSAEQYGVPQTRRRAVLIASLTHDVVLPAPTHSAYYQREPTRLDPGTLPWVSMADALGWGMTARPYVTGAAGTTSSGGTDPQALGGSGARATVQRELDAGRWRSRFNDQSGTPYDPNWPALRPATTIAGRGLVPNPGSTANRFNGQTKSRNDGVRVTVAEAGVLQSFPVDYPWTGTDSDQYQQVGDAVPPLLASAIIRAAAG